MIDHLDKQTQPMDLEPKRSRGRPATGQALSNAERQRLYRERQKAQRNGKNYEALDAALISALDRCDKLAAKLGRANEKIKELEAQLASRNEKEIKNGKIPGTWIVERKERGTKKWEKSGDAPESSWDAAKGSVDYMQFTSGTGQDDNWRARCTAGTFKGMIYWPKAPK